MQRESVSAQPSTPPSHSVQEARIELLAQPGREPQERPGHRDLVEGLAPAEGADEPGVLGQREVAVPGQERLDDLPPFAALDRVAALARAQVVLEALPGFPRARGALQLGQQLFVIGIRHDTPF
jgi:hypothetical protein